MRAAYWQGAVGAMQQGPKGDGKNQDSGAFADFSRSLKRLVNKQALQMELRARGQAANREVVGADFCPRCGLMLSSENRPGSLSAYLFQDLRCKCKPDPSFAPGEMSRKLSRLQENDQGQTFERSEAKAQTQIELVNGAIIGGAYKIKTMIGQGGMGVVYLADHLGLKRECALKVIPPDEVTEIGWLRFQQEARAIAMLNHINMIKISDLAIHEGCLPFYAMEYVPGRTLAEILKENGPLPQSKMLDIFLQVLDGIEHAHKNGIIHRDLKPANILVGTTGTGSHQTVKILDFGLAKLSRADRLKQSLTATGDVFGSPFYMSPEQCCGESIDGRSDIYSLGCTLYECLNGRPPFDSGNAYEIMASHRDQDAPTLSAVAGSGVFGENIETVLAKTLRKDPIDRYQNIAELRADINRVQRGEAVQAVYMPGSGAARARVRGEDHQQNTAHKGMMFSTAASLAVLAVFTLAIAGGAAALIFANHKAPFKTDGPALGSAEKKQTGPSLANSQDDIANFEKANPVDESLGAIVGGADGSARQRAQTAQLPEVDFEKHPFYQGIVTVNGRRFKRYEFPQSSGLGKMTLRDKTGGKIFELSGQVDLPDKLKLWYEPGEFALRNPAILAGFREGDFGALDLSWPSDYPAKLLDKFPQSFWKMTSVETLSLHNLPGAGSPAAQEFAVNLLSRFQHLKALEARVGIEAGALKRFKCFQLLQVFSTVQVTDVSDYLRALEGSSNLTVLQIEFPESMTQANFTSIAKMTSLQKLTIRSLKDMPLTAGQLTSLTKLLSLSEVHLPNLSYTPETIRILRQMKALHVLTFDSDSSWGAFQRYSLKKTLPDCIILCGQEKI